jgi:hypothetical protein
MANEEAVEDRFLKELYGLTDGQATRVVRGEELAKRLGMDPEEETDNARFLGTARRVEEEGFVITNKTGPEVRDYSSLSLTYGGIRAVEEGPPDGRVLLENLKVTRCQKCQKSSESPFGTFGTQSDSVFEENRTLSLVLHNFVRRSFFIPPSYVG